MARGRLDRESVLKTAARIADKKGLSNLTMASLAAELKIRTPSLYSHFDKLIAIEDGLTLLGLEGLLQVSLEAAAGLSGEDAFDALARAHRDFAKAHPGLYAATLRHAEDRIPEIRAVAGSYLKLVLAVLRGFQLDGDSALHAARCIHSALRGFVSLELNDGMGLAIPVDDSFEMMLTLLKAGISKLSVFAWDHPSERPL
jgi:AcrR family transcriptional regulator